MKILIDQKKLPLHIIEGFFDEKKVEKYLFKKSTDKPIRFPWETKAPRVYKYKNFFIKVHGFYRKHNYITGLRMGHQLLSLHNYFKDNNINTVRPVFIGIKGKYSVMVTHNIEKLGLKLLSDCDPETLKDSLIKINDDLEGVGLYHGDNKGDNSTINIKTKETVLLDIDSIKKPLFLIRPKWKLKKKTKKSLDKKIKEIDSNGTG